MCAHIQSVFSARAIMGGRQREGERGESTKVRGSYDIPRRQRHHKGRAAGLQREGERERKEVVAFEAE